MVRRRALNRPRSPLLSDTSPLGFADSLLRELSNLRIGISFHAIQEFASISVSGAIDPDDGSAPHPWVGVAQGRHQGLQPFGAATAQCKRRRAEALVESAVSVQQHTDQGRHGPLVPDRAKRRHGILVDQYVGARLDETAQRLECGGVREIVQCENPRQNDPRVGVGERFEKTDGASSANSVMAFTQADRTPVWLDEW